MKKKKNEHFKRNRSAIKEYYYAIILVGIIVGASIPFFINELATTQVNMERMFFLLCIGAGMLLGLANYGIFKIFIQKELKSLKRAMDGVAKLSYLDAKSIDREKYTIAVSSADLIGEVQVSFNQITENILMQLELSEKIKEYQESLAKEIELEILSYTISHQFLTLLNAKFSAVYAKIGGELKIVGSDGLKAPYKLVKESSEFLEVIEKNMVSKGILEYPTLYDAPVEIFEGEVERKYCSEQMNIIPLFEQNGTLVGIIVLIGDFPTLSLHQNKKIQHYLYHTSLYFQNVLLHSQLIDVAELDGLTQIYNRLFGMNYIQEEYKWAIVKQKTLSFIMLDIDYFKKINDTYGHGCGDFVLKEIAKMLSFDLRAKDIVCRYGGEEFLIALVGSDLENSVKVSERIRRSIEERIFIYQGDEIKVTVSIGVTTLLAQGGESIEDAIKISDKALYIAKGKGRNQTIVYDAPEYQTVEGY